MSAICAALHRLVNQSRRYGFPMESRFIPQNGIYVLFEMGELGHEANRIVRIGTHTGKNQLHSRLTQHFVNQNKDRSIFRKNVGRALLNETKDSFLVDWNIDLTTRAARIVNGSRIDQTKQKATEEQVSEYIQRRFHFMVLPVAEKLSRLHWESRIISTVSLCEECSSSQGWLGRSSPVKKIVESGLWQVNELYKTPFSSAEFDEFAALLAGG